jgi:hypothetical protein
LVVPTFALDGETVARMTAALEDLLARNPDTDRNVMFCPHLPGYGPQAMTSGDPVWLEIARRPDILDLVGRIMGPDVILWGTTVFGKPAGTGQVIPWHQDAPHWPIEPKATTSVWIALDRCTPDNGCLRYIPGSHGGEARHIDINQTPEGKEAAVRLILDPDRRAAFVLRFMPASSYFDHVNGDEAARRAGAVTDYNNRPLYLLRGESTGGSDLGVGHG